MNQHETDNRNELVMAAEIVEYKVTIRTGDRQDAGTDADVTLVLSGFCEKDRVFTTPVVLNPLISGNAFERGSTDVVTFKAERLTSLEYIMIEISGYSAPDWFVDTVTISSPSLNEDKTLNIHSWIYPHDKNCYYVKASRIDYCFEIKTADESNAGTDANITIGLRDSNGCILFEKSVNRYISGNAFERGNVDTFAIPLGPMVGYSQLIIKTDMAYAAAGWKPAYVKIESTPGPVTFTINEWIDDKSKEYVYERV